MRGPSSCTSIPPLMLQRMQAVRRQPPEPTPVVGAMRSPSGSARRERGDGNDPGARALRLPLRLEEAPEDRTEGAAFGVEPVRHAGVAGGQHDPVPAALAELPLPAVQ